MALSETQIFGFAENVLKLIEKERTVLKKGGMDVDAVIEALKSLMEAAKVANANQHDMFRQSRASTEVSVRMTRQLYVGTSGFLDMSIAAAGKDTDESEEFRTLRSRVSRPPPAEEPPEEVAKVQS